MEPKFAWLIAFVSIYWAYCLFWGFKGARSAKTSTDYFLAGRSIGIWVFVLAATATSFSGWTFVGHPGKIFTDGLPYAFASFYALTIPFTGVLFLRRQWVLGKAYRYITPGEMYSDYYGGNSIRLLTVLVAFLFSVPYLGVQLRASGVLFNVLTDGLVSVNFGMFTLSAIVMIYVASGGLRSVAFVDCAQAILLALGITILGGIAIYYAGGYGGFTNWIGRYSNGRCYLWTKPDSRWVFNESSYPRQYSNGVCWIQSNRWSLDWNHVYDLYVCFNGDSIITCIFYVGFC